MALFSECGPQCAQTVLDTADIVRDGDFLPLSQPLNTRLHLWSHKNGDIHSLMGCTPPQSKHFVTAKLGRAVRTDCVVWNLSNAIPASGVRSRLVNARFWGLLGLVSTLAFPGTVGPS
jgi:hypothetical protein